MTQTSETTPTSGAKPRIVFFGTGPVAAASLELLTHSFEIEAVVTKPKPERHKGSFPVLDIAEIIGTPIIYVTNHTAVSEKIAAQAFKSRVAVLIDFGIIVSQDVIDAFPLGIINSHFSLLPEWRGADPITFAILSGQKRTGVSLMSLVQAMDEGPILALGVQENIDCMTTPELTDSLIKLSYALLKVELPRYIGGEAKLIPQDKLEEIMPNHPSVSYSRKLTKADSVLDFTKSAVTLEREIRAFAEWPKSRTDIAGREVVITGAHVETGSGQPVGTIFAREKKLCVQTADGLLVIDTLKPAGKPEMSAAAFLNGYGKDL